MRPQNPNQEKNVRSKMQSAAIPVFRSKRTIVKRGFLYLAMLLAFTFIYTFLEPFWLETKTIRIADNDIPAVFDQVRIVFLTDIHHGPFFSKSRLRRLVQTVNRLRPDLILLGGDYVHRSPEYIEPCFQELSLLQATYGIYGVLGNHDHWEDPILTRESMQKAGIQNLDNKGIWIEKNGQRIRLGGVGDFLYDTPDIRPALSGLQSDDFLILVTHNPDFFEGQKTDMMDLAFAGHTHGGQVTFFGLWAPLIPSQFGQKYRSGVIQMGNAKLIISHGIGTITPPVRFFARPQIIVATLQAIDN